jgi:hypothetical protein
MCSILFNLVALMVKDMINCLNNYIHVYYMF